MKGKGKIRKSLINTGDDKYVRIELLDDNGLLITRINMSIEEFGLLMSSEGHVKCDYNLYNNYDLLGKTLETKEQLIKLENGGSIGNFKEKMLELVKPYEVAGWKANSQDTKSWNYHNAKNGYYKVGFSRYV